MSTDAEADILPLRDYADRLLAIAREATRGVRYREDDHFAFMALAFLSKQIDHMEALLLLNRRRDTVLIARTMLEGMSQLLWAAQDKPTRAFRWRAFAWVHDWRTMRDQLELGRPPDDDLCSRIEEGLRREGERFLSQRALKARQKRRPLPRDPYVRNWTGMRADQIFREVRGDELYEVLYRTFSDWSHWGTGAVGGAIQRQGETVGFDSSSAAQTASALTAGFQCLMQTTWVLSIHLDLRLEEQLRKLRDEFIAWRDRKTDSQQ